MDELKTLQRKYECAHAALAAAIDKKFPIGAEVVCIESGRVLCGIVQFESRDHYVRFRNERGKRKLHDKHYSHVQLGDGRYILPPS